MKFIVFKLNLLKKIALIFMLLGLLCVNFDTGKVASVYFGQSLKKVPIYCVETDKSQVAITFDAAWGADKTEEIMRICNEFNVGATFFLVGFWVDKYSELVEKISSNGFEIGTHSNTHPDMAKLSAQSQREELEKSISLIENITNKKVKLFRAPYGSYNNSLLDVAEQLSLKTIQWDVDSLDWKGLSAEQMSIRVLNNVKNGSIILFHNNSDHITDALPIILDRLQKRGYEISCVGDLIYDAGYTIDHTGKQKKNISEEDNAQLEV